MKDKKQGVPIIGGGSVEVKDAINEAIDSMVTRFNPVFESFQQAVSEIGRRLEVVEEIHKTRPAFPDTINVVVKTERPYCETVNVEMEEITKEEEQ
jgi:hypothetical protein